MRFFTIWVILCFCTSISFTQNPEINVTKIYESDQHDAFTSLIKFQEKYYCAFRSGEHHVYGADGVSKILASPDKKHWKEVATLKKTGVDLRDPKLSIAPDGRIIALVGGSIYRGKELLGMHTQVSFSDLSGLNFSKPQPISLDPTIRSDYDWLWAITWYEGMAYGVVYQYRGKRTKLVRSSDGIHYEFICELDLDGRPNEARVRFDEMGTMYILHRRDDDDQMGYWGSSRPPFKNWTWKQMKHRIGGPDFVILPNDDVLVGSRIYREGGNGVGILRGTKNGVFPDLWMLPSGGDCSYPSFLVEPHRILMSYYSSHEGNADIYLAEIPR